MSEAKDPTLFQFSLRAFCRKNPGRKNSTQRLEDILQNCLLLDVPVERIQVELAEDSSILGTSKGFLWEGSLVLVLDMQEDTAEADLGIEDVILSRDLTDPKENFYRIELGVGAVPHNVENHDLFDRILDAAHNVSERQDHRGKPEGWYVYPGGGYRFWNGDDWVGEAIDQPPRKQHPLS